MKDLNSIDAIEIQPLSDEALESVAGGKGDCNDTSGGTNCCSCENCSNETPTQPGTEITPG
jgi:hypothetical protein